MSVGRDIGSTMHVVLIGAGALGTVYGVRTAASGAATVSFVLRPGREVPASSSMQIERVERSERQTLVEPSWTRSIPNSAHVVVLAIRADNLDDSLSDQLLRGPSVPVVSLTPLLPSSVEHLRSLARGRLTVGMPGVVARRSSKDVVRYWLPRVAPTLIDSRSSTDRAVRDLVDVLVTAGIPTRFEQNVETLNQAAMIAFLPWVLLLDASGGAVDRALASRARLQLTLDASDECRHLALQVGRTPVWAGLLLRFLGRRWLRVGITLARRAYPESIRFVEQHFGHKTHAQNIRLAVEILSLGQQHGIKMEAVDQLVTLCSNRTWEPAPGGRHE